MKFLLIFLKTIYCLLQMPLLINGMDSNSNEVRKEELLGTDENIARRKQSRIDEKMPSGEMDVIDGYLSEMSDSTHWKWDMHQILGGFVELVKLAHKNDAQSRELSKSFKQGFRRKQPEAFYAELAEQFLDVLEKNAEASYEFIVGNLLEENVQYWLRDAQIELNEYWKDFMEWATMEVTGKNKFYVGRKKAILLQYSYIAQIMEMLNSRGNGQTKLFHGGNLVAEFGASLANLFRAYLARWIETGILAKMEREVLPLTVGRCKSIGMGSNWCKEELAKFAVRISLLYPNYQNVAEEAKDDNQPRKKKMKMENVATTSSSMPSISSKQKEWIELMEAYLRPNRREKRFKELDFRFYDNNSAETNLDEIIVGMNRAIGHWEFDKKTGREGPKLVEKMIKMAYDEVKADNFVIALEKIIVKSEAEKQRIWIISFYIRFYRRILAKFLVDSGSNLCEWLQRVADYILTYKYLLTTELIAQNERNKNLENLFSLLYQAENNVNFDEDFYKIEPKRLTERRQIYAILFGIVKTDEEAEIHKAELIKFTIRNTVLPLVEDLSRSSNEDQSSSSSNVAAAQSYFEMKRSTLLKLSAPVEFELIAIQKENEKELLEKMKKTGIKCLEFILNDGLLAAAIRNQVYLGKNIGNVFSAIRKEMLSWGGENPLLKDLDAINEEFSETFAKINKIKNMSGKEKKSAKILFIFTRLFSRLNIGFEGYGDEFAEEKMIGKYENKREGTVLEAILIDQTKYKFFTNKVELAKILAPNMRIRYWRGHP